MLLDGVYVFLVGLVLEGLTLVGVVAPPLVLTIVVRVGVEVVRTVSPLLSVVVTVRVPLVPLVPLGTLVVDTGAIVLVRVPVLETLPLLTSPDLPLEVLRSVTAEVPTLFDPELTIRPPGPRLVCPPPPLTTSEPLRPLTGT